MVLVGSPIAVDFTTAAWQRPRIANLQLYSVFGVVAQVRSGNGPVQVSARIVGNNGSLVTGQFTVAQSSVDELRPDIGGDPSTEPRAAFFTVVWEHAFNATDHDIHATQFTATGTLGSVIYLQTDTHYQSNPSISKSDGATPGGSQRVAIAKHGRSTD